MFKHILESLPEEKKTSLILIKSSWIGLSQEFGFSMTSAEDTTLDYFFYYVFTNCIYPFSNKYQKPTIVKQKI